MEEKGFQKPVTTEERLQAEEKYHFLSEHFEKIKRSEAILVVNPAKHGVACYIGGNSFLEMGVAYFLKKKIYVLYDLPTMEYSLELHAMQPVVLQGDITNIEE